MSALTVNILGFSGFAERIKAAGEEKLKLVSAEMEESMRTMVGAAQRDAPVDMGRLKDSISYQKVGQLEFEMICQISYAAYIEFGTRSKVVIPPGLEAEAAKFKGKGSGDYFDFLNAILDWVKRNGIGFEHFTETNQARTRFGHKTVSRQDRLHDVAEAIAFSIIRNGIKPHPFFFKQLDEEKPKLLQRIREIL